MQLFTQFNFGLLTVNSVIVSGAVVVLSLRARRFGRLRILALPVQRIDVCC